jgi:hypothetical protein
VVPSSDATPSATPSAVRTLMVYAVTKKDKSLTQIAVDHGITLAQIELANPISSFQSHNYNIIFAGMQIYIPWPEWTPAPPPPTPTPTPTPTPRPTPTPKPTQTPAY